jgi:hypothetical protein
MSDPLGLEKLEKKGVHTDEVSMTFEDSLGFEEWSKVMKGLSVVSDFSSLRLPWMIGDAINFGMGKWPERYAQSVEFTGLKQETLYNYTWICRSVPRQVRREKLGISVHQEVASLKDLDRQDYFLSQAEVNGWNKMELRAAVKGKPPKKALPDKMPDFTRDIYSVESFEEWYKENEEMLAQQEEEYMAYRQVWNAAIEYVQRNTHNVSG